MRFWITKNSELPVREQLASQVLLGILSDDLPAGTKLPSVRAVARRHRIHSNTVSAAYHDLLERGWLELRRGSGLYVRPLRPADDTQAGLDQVLAAVLQKAHLQGYEPEDVLHRLEHLVRPRVYERILITEPEPAMREILRAEISEHLAVAVDALEDDASADLSRSVVVALTTRAVAVRRTLAQGVLCISLRLRSVPRALESEARPEPDTVISIVSRSAEIRQWAQRMLIAVGLAPECLCELDGSADGWKDRLGLSALVITDVVCAKELPAGCAARVFRVVADSSIEELREVLRGRTIAILPR